MAAGIADLRAALLAAAAYFLVAITLGFILGVLRVSLLAPRTGALAAVALELPVMLAATWMACAHIIEALKIKQQIAARLLMGWGALALVLLAELGIAVWMQGGTPAAFLQSLATSEGALGLCGQALFACFPVMQRERSEG